MANNDIVLPESLVAELIDKSSEKAEQINAAFHELANLQPSLRSRLEQERVIREIIPDTSSPPDHFAIDGAHCMEVDRASAYSISCVARVGPEQEKSDYAADLFVLPHIASAGSLSAGFMFMQEIMMAVETAEQNPDAICVIDGSKISNIIKLNQFYGAVAEEMPEQLDAWRSDDPIAENNLLKKFERRNWLASYFQLDNILGSLKLVTTSTLIRKYIPEFLGRFDDKLVAALVLKPNEMLAPVLYEHPLKYSRKDEVEPDSPPYHIHKEFPFSKEFEDISKDIIDPEKPNCLCSFYYHCAGNSAVYKIEFCKSSSIGIQRMIDWFESESIAPEMREPYPLYVADRFVKEAVSVTKRALSEIVRRKSETDWGWHFTGPYRSN